MKQKIERNGGPCPDRAEPHVSDRSLFATRPHRNMLVLFETSAGYALFKVLDEGKLQNPDKLFKEFQSPEQASKL